MNIIIAIILGIIEGLTEFIPVSSTGHLIIAADLLNFTDEKAKIFEVVIQFGAISAAIIIYFQRLLALIPRSKKASGFNGFNGLWLLFLTTLPSVLLGLIFHDFIKERLFSSVAVAAGLLGGGIVLVIIDRFKIEEKAKKLDNISPKQALMIGLCQIMSLFPGVSRAASTIVGGKLAGLDRKTSVEYSFLAAIPIIFGAGLIDMIKGFDILGKDDYIMIVFGSLAAFLSAFFAIKFFIEFINKHSLAVFGWYRIGLACLVIIWLIFR